MKRGDLVMIALQGDHGKPRPALIIQADPFGYSTHVALLPLTTYIADAPLMRIPISATSKTGLTKQSYAMIDRITTASREKIGGVFGHLDDRTMVEINRALIVFLGLV